MIAAVCPICNYREVLPDHADGQLQLCHSCGLPRGIHAIEQDDHLDQPLFHAPPAEWMEVPLLQWDDPRPNAKPEPLPDGFVSLGKPKTPDPKPVYPPLPELPAAETVDSTRAVKSHPKSPTEPQPVSVSPPTLVPVETKHPIDDAPELPAEMPPVEPPKVTAAAKQKPQPVPMPAPNPKLRFACNGCGVQFKVSVEKAGKKGKCPRCGEPYVVPGTPKPKPSKSRATVKAQPAASTQPQRQIFHRCRRCRTPLMSAESLAGMVDTCPACGGATPVPAESTIQGQPNLPRTRRTGDVPTHRR